ncbi:ganglioside GM2 activator [Tetranychus urticae]|uniref:MD-2-related lipid-recognition domain-containing protein n=1 Tax=Tetranychus urticae TaxID=32264 RepID=T1KLZ6_TETUR|nr:ganglioside GM2 activator [Tetranychus urticae]
MFQLIIYCLLPLLTFGAINWEDCGQADRSLVLRKFNVKGDKVFVDGNNSIEAEVDFSLLDPLDEEVTMSSEFRRYFSILGVEASVKIPCRSDVGSCSGSFCYFVDSYKNLANTFAAQLKVPPSCKMQVGRYMGNVSYPIPLKDIGHVMSAALQYAASGKYGLVMRWYYRDAEIGCVSIMADVEFKL